MSILDLSSLNSPRIALVGASGLVGRKILAQLLWGMQRVFKTFSSDTESFCPHDFKNFTPPSIDLFSSEKTAGKILKYQQLYEEEKDVLEFPLEKSALDSSFSECWANYTWIFQNTEKALLEKSYDIYIFATESWISKRYIPHLDKGYVIDSSSAYRLDPSFSLIVPGVNGEKVTSEQRFYAHANCIVSPVVNILKSLEFLGIQRAVLATYQSVSGAGKGAMEHYIDASLGFFQNMADPVEEKQEFFPRPIASNVIAQIGDWQEEFSEEKEAFREDKTSEEWKISKEIQNVMGWALPMNIMSVRVPLLRGHSCFLNISFQSSFELSKVEEALKKQKGIVSHGKNYLTPREVIGSMDVHVGRISRDFSQEHGLNLWICSDNLLRGASLDAVYIVYCLSKFFKK